LDALFGIYDTDNSGGIDYKEFSTNLFGRPVGSATANRGKSTPEELLDRLRTKLSSRGARGIIGLGK
jgi:hypothetical protein